MKDKLQDDVMPVGIKMVSTGGEVEREERRSGEGATP